VLCWRPLRIFRSATAPPLGISNGKINYCLRALLAKVWSSWAISPSHGIGLDMSADSIRHCRRAALTHRFLQRKVAEYEALKTEIDAASRPRHP
jgi:hypothetical protein